jgi:hypothetical protein
MKTEKPPQKGGFLTLSRSCFLLIHTLLRFNAERSMGNGAQALLVDELAGYAADTISLVLDADERLLEVIDELDLAAGELGELFTLHRAAAVFHVHITILGVFGTGFVLAGDETLEIAEFLTGRRKAPLNKFAELRQLFVAIAVDRSGLLFWVVEQ